MSKKKEFVFGETENSIETAEDSWYLDEVTPTAEDFQFPAAGEDPATKDPDPASQEEDTSQKTEGDKDPKKEEEEEEIVFLEPDGEGGFIDPEASEEEDPENTSNLSAEAELNGIRAAIATRMEKYGFDPNNPEYDLATMDEETLLRFSDSVDDAILDLRFQELKHQDSNLAKVLDFIENGGDPKAIAKIFREQDEVDKIDVSTEDGKAKKISSYYREVRGWSEDKVKNRIDRLKTQNGIEDEFEEINDEYNSYFESKKEALVNSQREELERKEKIRVAKMTKFQEAIVDYGLSPDLAKAVQSTAFGMGLLPDKTQMSILEHRILSMQNRPELNVKLAHFLTDPEAYDNYIIQKSKNKEVATNMKNGFRRVENRPASNNLKPAQKGSAPTIKFDFNK